MKQGEVQAHWKALQPAPPTVPANSNTAPPPGNHGSTGWKRDLLRECVEPNPGPSWQEILKDLVDKKLGGPKEAQKYDVQLNDLGQLVGEVCGLPNEKKIREKFLVSTQCAEFASCGDAEETIIGFLGELVALPAPGPQSHSVYSMIFEKLSAYPPSQTLPPQPPQLIERSEQIDEIVSIVKANLREASKDHQVPMAKADYNIPVFAGGAGIGKTTLGYAAA
eukprot:Phypoly_transcript_02612.p1 GENE.Phypoly_transcript_02612~~Phypoly_transcript_02612.p1  ORF type:complete len:222 (-),score=37.70 Phypoly_transcript_02612:1781-2446(-)